MELVVVEHKGAIVRRLGDVVPTDAVDFLPEEFVTFRRGHQPVD